MARDVRKVVESEDEIVDGQEEEEEYDENADEDFNPDEAAAEGDEQSSESSEDEAEAQKSAGKKGAARGRGKRRKIAATAGKNEEDERLDSGDEATIRERQKSRKKQKKRGKGDEVADVDEDDDDSAGEDIVIKTRAQRLAEQVEKKQRKRRVDGSAVTIDVDSLWADLSALPVGRPAEPPSSATAENTVDGEGEADKENVATPASTAPQQQQNKKQSELVTIKRRIEYAGEVTEVEERVPRGSKEAQAYLAEHPEAATEPSNGNDSKANPLRRPLRRASIFEPNPTGAVKGVPPDRLRPRAPSRLDVLMARKRAEEELKKKAERLSTVQKSALDWRGFVNSSEGLRDELDVYGKSKQGFLAREAFLDRAAGARDAAAREARLKG